MPAAVVRHQYNSGRINAAAYTDTKWTLNGAAIAMIPIQTHTPVNVATATCERTAGRILGMRSCEQAVADHEGVDQLQTRRPA